MNKSDKKTERAIVNALNDVCESLKNNSDGFSWLTHFVDYSHFPQSLKIVLVYDTNQHLEAVKNQAPLKTVLQLTERRLKEEGVPVKHIDKAMFFDSKDKGADFDDLNWCRKYSNLS